MTTLTQETFTLNTWDDLAPLFEALEKQTIETKDQLINWMKEISDLEAAISENLAWRYIKMTIDTTDKDLTDAYSYFVAEIQPKIAPFENNFNKKFIANDTVRELDQVRFKNHIRGIKKQLELFREENIELFSKSQQESQKYGAISGKQAITYKGEELTLQQASKILKETNREVRKEVFELLNTRRLEDKDALNELYSSLIKIRTEIAKNADFENFRDYKFEAMGRFDYTPKHCFEFHKAVGEVLVPLSGKILQARKQDLGFDTLKPYDTSVDTTGKDSLKPFETSEQLTDKTINMFSKIRPFFGECIQNMKNMKHLDLASKKGKAPGGYNYPLYVSGYPFIFMNSVGSQRDLITMVHEGGHAVHSVLTKDLDLVSDKSLPSEVAELASMSMELISMDYWDEFYKNEEELKRAKKEHIEDIFSVIPWVATIDKFQHWIYENPNHTLEERKENWLAILREFGSNIVDWTGYEEAKAYSWQKQLHLFEVPFYYIEYGFAQLGAIAMWRNFKQNKEKTLDQYQAALSLGYTKSIPEIYETAGIKFDFSKAYIQELMDFLWKEYELVK
jgi:oligoendopeptidase F